MKYMSEKPFLNRLGIYCVKAIVSPSLAIYISRQCL